MNMRASGNVSARRADDLAVFQDILAAPQVAQRNLVARRNRLLRGDIARQPGARRHGAQGDKNVVAGVQTKRKGLVGHFCILHGVTMTFIR